MIDLDGTTESGVEMATVASPPETSVFLVGISWETYEAILHDHRDRSVPRFAYDGGVLEIVSPSTSHEEDNRTLASLIEILAEEWSLEFRSVGSMTFNRRDLLKGIEPDSSYYIGRAAEVRGRRQIELPFDPPPDLAIEVDVFNSSLPKLPILARMGVPEVWRLTDDRVAILALEAGAYREARQSLSLPPLTGALLTTFLAETQAHQRLNWIRSVREWARSAR